MLELLQDVHFPLNLLSSYTTPACPTLALLDELGCIFNARTLLYAAFDNCKLPTANHKRRQKKTLTLLNIIVLSLLCCLSVSKPADILRFKFLFPIKTENNLTGGQQGWQSCCPPTLATFLPKFLAILERSVQTLNISQQRCGLDTISQWIIVSLWTVLLYLQPVHMQLWHLVNEFKSSDIQTQYGHLIFQGKACLHQ